MVFKNKTKECSPQITILENLDNNEDPKETYIDLIYMGSRKDSVLKIYLRNICPRTGAACSILKTTTSIKNETALTDWSQSIFPPYFFLLQGFPSLDSRLSS